MKRGRRRTARAFWSTGCGRVALRRTPSTSGLKDIAPSGDLRRRFHGHPEQWDQFRAAYAGELEGAAARAALDALDERLRAGPVTLLYAARDDRHNNAMALKLWLDGRRSGDVAPRG